MADKTFTKNVLYNSGLLSVLLLYLLYLASNPSQWPLRDLPWYHI